MRRQRTNLGNNATTSNVYTGYNLRHYRQQQIDPSDSESDSSSHEKTTQRTKRRRTSDDEQKKNTQNVDSHFTSDDNHQMLNYLVKTNSIPEALNVEVWKRMEAEKILSTSHTPLALLLHFGTYLLPRCKHYAKTRHTLKQLKKLLRCTGGKHITSFEESGSDTSEIASKNLSSLSLSSSPRASKKRQINNRITKTQKQSLSSARETSPDNVKSQVKNHSTECSRDVRAVLNRVTLPVTSDVSDEEPSDGKETPDLVLNPFHQKKIKEKIKSDRASSDEQLVNIQSAKSTVYGSSHSSEVIPVSQVHVKTEALSRESSCTPPTTGKRRSADEIVAETPPNQSKEGGTNSKFSVLIKTEIKQEPPAEAVEASYSVHQDHHQENEERMEEFETSPNVSPVRQRFPNGPKPGNFLYVEVSPRLRQWPIREPSVKTCESSRIISSNSSSHSERLDIDESSTNSGTLFQNTNPSLKSSAGVSQSQKFQSTGSDIINLLDTESYDLDNPLTCKRNGLSRKNISSPETSRSPELNMKKIEKRTMMADSYPAEKTRKKSSSPKKFKNPGGPMKVKFPKKVKSIVVSSSDEDSQTVPATPRANPAKGKRLSSKAPGKSKARKFLVIESDSDEIRSISDRKYMTLYRDESRSKIPNAGASTSSGIRGHEFERGAAVHVKLNESDDEYETQWLTANLNKNENRPETVPASNDKENEENGVLEDKDKNEKPTVKKKPHPGEPFTVTEDKAMVQALIDYNLINSATTLSTWGQILGEGITVLERRTAKSLRNRFTRYTSNYIDKYTDNAHVLEFHETDWYRRREEKKRKEDQEKEKAKQKK